MDKSIARRNARLTLWITFFDDLAFILPIWLIFGTQELGYSATITTTLFVIIWMGGGLLEIPTGALSDRMGRKRMFVIGLCLLSLYPIGYILRAPIWVIGLLSLISAAGSALRSGTLAPVIQHGFTQSGLVKKDYHRYLSNQKVITFSARAVSGIAGGLLYAIQPSYPYIAIFLTYIIMIFLGLAIVDTTYNQRSKLKNNAHIAETLRRIRKHRLIVMMFTIYIFSQLVTEAAWIGYQLFYEADGLSTAAIGAIFTCIALLSAAGSYTFRYISDKTTPGKIQLFTVYTLLATTILLAAPWPLVRLFAVAPRWGLALG